MKQGDFLRRLIGVLEGLDVPHMVVGSVASGAFGEPRMTKDVDVVIDPNASQLRQLCRAFSAPDFYVSEEAAMGALRDRGQFNIIHPLSGNKIDLLIASDSDWGRSELSRRQRMLILPDLEGYCARPEDVILGKMQYYRGGGSEKHLRDIAGILCISDDQVDRQYVALWAERLGLTEIWEAVLRRIG